MAGEVDNLLVRIVGDAKQYFRELQKTEKETEATADKISKAFDSAGDKLIGLGTKLSLGITAPLAVAAGVVVNTFGVQEDAEFRLRAALEANGRQVNKLFADYTEFASAVQAVTTVGDESTIVLLSQAELMGVTGDNAKRAAQNAIGLAQALGINEKSAIRYAIALEQGSSTMLQRFLPNLREIEDESERVAVAQQILGRMFEVANARAETSAGKIQQLKNSWGDFQEQLGMFVAEALLPVIEKLSEIVAWLQDLSPETKQMIVQFAGWAAAIGPVVLALGVVFKVIGTIIGVLQTLGPALLIIVRIMTGWVGVAVAVTAALWPLIRRALEWLGILDKAEAKADSITSKVGKGRFRDQGDNPLALNPQNFAEDADPLAKLREAGERLVEQFRTPAEKYRDELGKITEMLMADVIDVHTYERALKALNDEFNADKIKAWENQIDRANQLIEQFKTPAEQALDKLRELQELQDFLPQETIDAALEDIQDSLNDSDLQAEVQLLARDGIQGIQAGTVAAAARLSDFNAKQFGERPVEQENKITLKSIDGGIQQMITLLEEGNEAKLEIADADF